MSVDYGVLSDVFYGCSSERRGHGMGGGRYRIPTSQATVTASTLPPNIRYRKSFAFLPTNVMKETGFMVCVWLEEIVIKEERTALGWKTKGYFKIAAAVKDRMGLP